MGYAKKLSEHLVGIAFYVHNLIDFDRCIVILINDKLK